MLSDRDREVRRLNLLIQKYHKCLKDHDMTDGDISEYVYISEGEIDSEGDYDDKV